jgi:Spy/CpxP family protein refolding chaperone
VSAPRRWTARLLVLGSFAALFAAGAAAGVAWERARGGGDPQFRVMVDGGRARIDAFNELGLTDDQRRRIEQVFVRAQPRTDAVLKETLPRLRAVTDSINQEVQAVLTPEQRRRLGRLEPRRVFALPHDSLSSH